MANRKPKTPERRERQKKYQSEYYKLHSDEIKAKTKEYQDQNKEKIRKYRAEYYKQNKDKIIERVREYCNNNKERVKESRKIRYNANKDKLTKYKKEWYEANKARLSARYKEEYKNRDEVAIQRDIEYKRKYREINHDKIINRDRKYRAENKDMIKNGKKDWYDRNKDRSRSRRREYYNHRRKTDISFKLAGSLRHRMREALKNQSARKSNHFSKLLGCVIKEARAHIEAQFKPGMTWENHGPNGWHIDHIRPLASFDLTDPQQQLEAFNYKNLQPLWAEENLSKGDKWDGDTNPDSTKTLALIVSAEIAPR